MNDNPLSPPRHRPPEQKQEPMLRHARIWRHMHGQDSDSLTGAVATLDQTLPVLGALAGNPKVTAKDVIKALAGNVANGHVTASQAVETISSMPAEPDQLRPWLRERYADNLAATVHAKAALMGRAQQAEQQQPAPMPGGMPNVG